MIVREWAVFESTLPEDVIEVDGEIVQNGGKSVIFAVAEILERLGCTIEGPEYAYDHGWDFHASKDGRRFFGQVTLIDGYWLLFNNPSLMDRWFRRYPPVYLDLLNGLARELAADPRFSKIRWFVQEDLAREGKGHDRPVEAGKAPRKSRRR